MVRERRRGAALFIVLLFSAFLAALAATAMRTSLSGARAAAAFADGVRADELGRGAADALAYRLATGDDAAKRGGALALRLPGADVTIDYLSESARLDVNLAPVPLVSALAAAAGAEPSEAEAIAARVTRFRAEAAARAKGTQAGTGAPPPPLGGLAAIRASLDALGPQSRPKPAAEPVAIRDASEIARAWGLSDTLGRALLPSLTVSNGTATVDPVLAGRLLVQALLGSDERTDDYLKRRRQGFIDKDSALALVPVPSQDFVSFQDVAAVRALVRVRVAKGVERRYEMVLAPPASSAQLASRPAGPGGTAAVPVLVAWRKLP